jgi:hypothetical protein
LLDCSFGVFLCFGFGALKVDASIRGRLKIGSACGDLADGARQRRQLCLGRKGTEAGCRFRGSPTRGDEQGERQGVYAFGVTPRHRFGKSRAKIF